MSDDQPHKRPSPDALLQEAKKEGRGRLKVFLGAAPGVGKTYEMLVQGRQRRLEGIDIVIGVVETHGRIETEMLTKGFEAIPKRRVPYRGLVLAEMDLDAILQRRPKLVLVDELAHTNVEGSRHPKRYMDVEELLDSGIDVYSTLNIQHVESLNDVVARITHIQVRETVPDSIIDRADDIELVDTTPDDLIQRLKEGKVYMADQAERAIRNYFAPGNLTALRELALRRTAQRVDQQMRDYMQTHAIEGPWEAGDRVLVCVDGGSHGSAVVRYGKRIADRMRASWTAIHVETASAQRSEKELDRVAGSLRLAQRLGGEAVTIPASDIADGIIAHAQANNFTHLVVARTQRSRWNTFLRAATAERIIRRAGDLNVHVMAEGEGRDGRPRRSEKIQTVDTGHSLDWKAYVAAFAITLASLGIALVLQRFLGIQNVALVFLTGVLATAVAYGLWPSLFACVVSMLAYNFFFLPPIFTFTIAGPENVVALFFFLVVALIASNLAARLRAQAFAARDRAKTTEDLYTFSRKLAGVITLDDLLWATAYQIASMLKLRVVLLLPEGETVAVRSGYPPEDILSEADLAAAKWCWLNNTPTGRGADTLPGAKRLFLPMRTGRGPVGVVGLDRDRPGPLLTPDQRRLFDALADQAALAIERIHLAEDVDRAKIAAETERLRGALLTSISHDLRTPLASIVGAAAGLKTWRTSLDEAAQDELIHTVQEEADRLNHFISNLLDMTRLESGAIAPKQDVVDVSDVVGSALRRAGKILAHQRVQVSLAADLPMLRLDPVLFEQVLFNLLDNAAKYAPPGSTVEVRGSRLGETVQLEVSDEGDGIPQADVERIFDKFYRVQAGDRRRVGTGLGLSICRGFVEAMGGSICAGNRSDRPGAVFTITLPVPQDSAAPEETSP
ncbi:MAG TPA: sensor histidine kinase KdpD [Rhizomicrobium sp.]|jgi:two-component system sensor histidine kinase KdpD